MGISHLLDDFGTRVGEQSISISDVSLEEERLAAFEQGYQAGWDDAAKAAREEANHISSDFAGNLQDISFTLAEAQTSLLAALRPLMTGLVESVLPKLANQTLGARVIETLSAMTDGAMRGPAQLVTAPVNVNALQSLLDEHDLTDVEIVSQASLGEGQVHVRASGLEQEIDLDAVLAQIDAAMDGFFEGNKKDIA